jgi:outer membrane protein OmpA-like peptidoglycan-associated protein
MKGDRSTWIERLAASPIGAKFIPGVQTQFYTRVSFHIMTSALVRLLLVCVCTIAAATTSLAQAPLSAEQIIERLKAGSGGAPPSATDASRPRTRGLSLPAGPGGSGPARNEPPAAGLRPPPVESTAVDQLFSKSKSRGLSSGERQTLAVAAEIRPTLDLTIYFDFDSAEIAARAIPSLVELGRALSSETLAGTRFLLAGHTDAKGGESYNLGLSQRRADAIKAYLVTQFRVDERRLLAIGYGKEQPKNKANPWADENRRVQIVNFGG